MPPVRVFVPNVDLFAPREVSRLLAASEIGKLATEDEDGDDEDGDEGGAPKVCYTVVGTVSAKGAQAPKWVSEVIEYDETDKEAITETLMSCQVVVWDIMVPGQIDGCSWAVETLKDRIDDFTEPKTFICLSSLMTWAKTLSADPEDTESPVLEDEFRRRRPHNRYKLHLDLERQVLKCGRKTKGKLSTYVTASGIQYGAGEDTLHSLFKAAWHQTPGELPVYGLGTNALPCIHVSDFAAAVLNVVESQPSTKYIVAIDESRSTLTELTSCIAENLGTGAVKQVSAEDGVKSKHLTQQQLDLLSLNLRIDTNAIKDFVITWKAQTGLVEAIQPVVAEYKTARNLTPLKVCVLGPAGCNKSAYAERLCREYKLHHVGKDGVIKEAISKLETSAALLQGGNADDLDGDIQAQAESDRDLLDQLKTDLAESGGNYDPEQVTTWFRAKLRSMACLNQGFVLDGYPETEEQAKSLFAAADDAEDPDAPDSLTVPEFIFSLDGSDEFLKKWVMELPQGYAEAHGLTEAAFTESLSGFRARNAVENAVINYFDFQEIHPVDIDVEALDGFLPVPSSSPVNFEYLDKGEVMKKMLATIGKPHNYGPTPAEKAQINLAAEKAAGEAAAVEQMLKDMKDTEESEYHAAEQTKWDASLALVKEEEKQAVEASASPLRTFLVRHVMPTLTEGLVEVSKARPDDPVDFLAEFLFRHNPTPLLN